MPRKSSPLYQWSIIVMCSVTVFLEYAARNNINNAMVSMVKLKDESTNGKGGSNVTYYCPLQNSLFNYSFVAPDSVSTSGRADSTADQLLDWSPTTQGLILGSFWYGYIVLQVPAGRLSELFGGKWIVAIGLIASGLINLITPSIVFSVPVLITSRVILGLIQGGILPACFTLIITWLPRDRRSLGFGLVNVGGNLGAVFAAAFTGYISQEYNWSYSFYLIGGLTIIWTLCVWIPGVSNCPDELSPEESKEIVPHRRSSSLASSKSRTFSEASSTSLSSSLQSKSPLKSTSSDNASLDMEEVSKDKSCNSRVPWLAIFTNPVVLAAACARFTGTFGYLTLQTKLPAYLVDMLHVAPSMNGFLNSFLFVAVSFSMALGPFVSEVLISNNIFTRTTVRKIFSSIALYTLALCLLIVPMIGCNTNLIILTLVIGMFAYGFVTGGDVIVPAEISINYPSTIYSSLNSFSSLSGSLAPLIVGLILDSSTIDPSISATSDPLSISSVTGQIALKQSWDLVFYLTASIVSIGTTIFIIYGSSERQSFDFNYNQNTRRDQMDPPEMVKC